MKKLRVSSKTNINSLAGAVAGTVREDGKVTLQCIGAGALNQGIKAIAVARGFLAPQGIEICVLPGFVDLEVNGEERTSIVLEVRKL